MHKALKVMLPALSLLVTACEYMPDAVLAVTPQAKITDVSRNFINGKYIIDLDGDGDLDIVRANSSIQWLENNAGTVTVHTLPFTASLVFAADMDGDTDIDIVAVEGSSIRLYKNNGSQVFTESLVDDRGYSLVYDSNGIYLADMDSDGSPDILAAWFSQDWYKNNKLGSFTKNNIPHGGGKDVIAADIDQDGDMDFIESDNDIIWQVNDGNQNFSEHILLEEGGASSFPIDIDKDGDIDIISVRRRVNEIDLFVNDGSNNFSMQILAAEKNSPYIFASDIDNDGHIDVLNGSIWFKNDGNNNFIKQGTLTLDFQALIALAE